MRDLPLNRDYEGLIQAVTRRHFFKQAGFGLGAAALSSLLNQSLFAGDAAMPAAANPMAPKPPMFPARAKSIIYLFMAGAPSQLDLLDYKPKLQQLTGQNIPEEFLKGEKFAFIRGVPRLPSRE